MVRDNFIYSGGWKADSVGLNSIRENPVRITRVYVAHVNSIGPVGVKRFISGARVKA
jgi:hypothetical protein